MQIKNVLNPLVFLLFSHIGEYTRRRFRDVERNIPVYKKDH